MRTRLDWTGNCIQLVAVIVPLFLGGFLSGIIPRPSNLGPMSVFTQFSYNKCAMLSRASLLLGVDFRFALAAAGCTL